MTAYPDFLGPDAPSVDPDKARFHVIPVPFEKSVSYGKGTSGGPAAVLAASHQVDTFDGMDVPAEAGVCTHAPIACDGVAVEDMLGRVEEVVGSVVSAGKTPVVLGGEHTVTVGVVRALVQRFGRGFGVVQFDAHADLREEYEGDALSHACAMRRVLDMGVPCFQIGGRSLSREEAEFRRAHAIPFLDAAPIANDGVPRKVLPEEFPESIYVTFDVDVFDPSVLPATGTPEPGGLCWYDVMALLSKVMRGRQVLGVDVVELAPMAGMPASDFTAAKLVYTMMGIINRESRH